MQNVILIIICQFLLSCSVKKDNIVELMYNEHKTDWKIKKMDHKKDYYYFGTHLANCIMDVTPELLKGTDTWILDFASGKFVYIEAYDFKDPKKAEQLYNKSSQYATSLRTVSLAEWNLCGVIREWEFHYVLLDESRVYLIGANGNMVYKDGKASLETDPSNLLEAKETFEYIKSKL